VTVLAAASTSPSVWAQPGTLGFLVVFGMGVILYFVFRSMSRHLRKVNEAARAEAEAAAQAESADAEAMEQTGQSSKSATG
jgi:Na+-transporting methylmalonyl-CoA/oxaloacetate decarboxylase gamma subunit